MFQGFYVFGVELLEDACQCTASKRAYHVDPCVHLIFHFVIFWIWVTQLSNILECALAQADSGIDGAAGDTSDHVQYSVEAHAD